MAFLLLFTSFCIIMLSQIHHVRIIQMPNFNLNDVVADLTNMNKWRDPAEFKSELFVYDFNKRVFMTNNDHFIIKSSHPSPRSNLFMPDDVLFSKVSGLSEDKSRILFNLTPHLHGIGLILKEQLKDQDLASVRDHLADAGPDYMVPSIAYIKALKDSFLIYFDRLHEEIAA